MGSVMGGYRNIAGFTLLILILVAAYIFAPDEGPYDYYTYHVAGTLLNQGQDPPDIYNVTTLRTALKEQYGRSGLGPFFYTPAMLPLARAAALLPVEESVRFFRFLSLLLLIGSLGLLRTITGRWWPSWLLALSYPVYIQFFYNNWTPLLFAALLLFIFLESKKYPIPAGIMLAFAILLKPYVGIAMIPLAFSGKKKTFWSTSLTGIAAFLLTLPIYGISSWQAWAQQLFSRGSMGVYAIYNNLSLPAIIVRLFSPEELWMKPIAHGGFPLLTQMFILSLPLLFLILLYKRKDYEASLGIGFLHILLFAPFTWDHGYLLLVLLAALKPRYSGLLSLLLLPTLFYYLILDHLVFTTGNLLYLYSLLLYMPAIAAVSWVCLVSDKQLQSGIEAVPDV